jgi:metal-responsive CopG/Arc/MetJ family transcriptional regulator
MKLILTLSNSCTFGVSMDKELADRIDELAAREHRNRAQMCRVLMLEALDRREGQASRGTEE